MLDSCSLSILLPLLILRSSAMCYVSSFANFSGYSLVAIEHLTTPLSIIFSLSPATVFSTLRGNTFFIAFISPRGIGQITRGKGDQINMKRFASRMEFRRERWWGPCVHAMWADASSTQRPQGNRKQRFSNVITTAGTIDYKHHYYTLGFPCSRTVCILSFFGSCTACSLV